MVTRVTGSALKSGVVDYMYFGVTHLPGLPETPLKLNRYAESLAG